MLHHVVTLALLAHAVANLFAPQLVLSDAAFYPSSGAGGREDRAFMHFVMGFGLQCATALAMLRVRYSVGVATWVAIAAHLNLEHTGTFQPVFVVLAVLMATSAILAELAAWTLRRQRGDGSLPWLHKMAVRLTHGFFAVTGAVALANPAAMLAAFPGAAATTPVAPHYAFAVRAFVAALLLWVVPNLARTFTSPPAAWIDGGSGGGAEEGAGLLVAGTVLLANRAVARMIAPDLPTAGAAALLLVGAWLVLRATLKLKNE